MTAGSASTISRSDATSSRRTDRHRCVAVAVLPTPLGPSSNRSNDCKPYHWCITDHAIGAAPTLQKVHARGDARELGCRSPALLQAIETELTESATTAVGLHRLCVGLEMLSSSRSVLRYRGDVFVSDLRHFLDLQDDAPATAKRLGLQLAAIVRAASARPAGSGARSAVGCIRRPGRRPCEGFVMVFRRTNGEIAWSCDACGDEGVISGWEGSPVDVSGFDDSYAEGDTVTFVIARELFEVIRGVLLLDDACELLVARAESSAAGVVLTGRAGAFEELVEYIASEANAETDRRRVRLLDQACTALEAALVGE